MTSVQELADAVITRLLLSDPFNPAIARRDVESLLPSVSQAADDELRADLVRFAGKVAVTRPADAAEELTLAAIAATCHRELLRLDLRQGEHTVTSMSYSGPPLLMGALARMTLSDPRAGEDYLTRVQKSGVWIDEVAQRLRQGARRQRLPVRSLVLDAIAWADQTLEAGLPEHLASPPVAPGWAQEDTWREEVWAAAERQMVPAIARWRNLLTELAPACRSDAHAGLAHLSDGEADYQKAIELHTTLPLTAAELHEWGVEEVARLEEHAVRLGASIGLRNAAEVRDAARASAFELSPADSMRLAQAAIRRAEEWAPQAFAAPLPPPCVVEAMPSALAGMGMAPLYSPPRPDEGIPGRYLYNTSQPGIGAGWDREATAFHEAVPGHHLQVARQIAHPDLPLIQQLYLPAIHEGWGLYAETLAGEVGLYSDTRAQIGAVQLGLLRAVRLVVDTGMHALGWSRQRAAEYLIEHVAVPEPMLQKQIDRYIVWPGLALSYAVGQREILRLRNNAQDVLKNEFDLRQFHEKILQAGSIPLPVLSTLVHDWTSQSDRRKNGDKK